jgi:hypothetical protein
MRPIPPVVVFVVLLASTSCTRFSRTTTIPRVQPPPGTGQVQTDFRGPWLVVEVRSTSLTAGEGEPRSGVTLPGVGSEITFDDRGFVSSDRQELRREHLQLPVNTRVADYLNQSDGRTALYTLKLEPEPPPGGDQFNQVQMAFGTEDADHLLGIVFFHVAPIGGNPARRGTSLVRMQRR